MGGLLRTGLVKARVKLEHSLRAPGHDYRIAVYSPLGLAEGGSAGAMAALNFLQVQTECGFEAEVRCLPACLTGDTM
jgi:hypothetical protein